MLKPFTILIFISTTIFGQNIQPLMEQSPTPKQVHICSGHHHPDPVETFPIPPVTENALKNSSMINAPVITGIANESPGHIRVEWTEPAGCSSCTYVLLLDNDNNSSNGYYHYVGAGSNTSQTISRSSLNGSALNIGQNFNVYVNAYQNAYSDWSAPVSTSYKWDQVGHPNNDITYTYEGWTTQEEADLQFFIGRIKPIIHNIYGPPANPIEVKILRKDGFQVYYPHINEIHLDRDRIFSNREFHLLVHEILHSWRDNAIITADANWDYYELYSAYEEGFAQTGASDCMNAYINQYPNDHDLSDNPNELNKTIIFGSSREWNYDYRNQIALSTGAFYTSNNVLNRGLSFERYEMAAAVLKKIQIEYPTFYKDFNVEYYSRLDADHTLIVSKTLIKDVIATVAPVIEGVPASQWIDNQKILACEIISGRKIFNSVSQVYGNNSTYNSNRYHYYETFSSGYDYQGDPTDFNSYIFLNGTSGNGKIYNWNNQLVKSFTPTISNPSNGYGYFTLSLVNYNLDDTTPNYVYWGENVTIGLYKVEMTFGNTTQIDYRVLGSDLNTSNGVFGGILNGDGGQIYIDHEDFAAQAPLQIINSAFTGTRNWINNYNSLTGGYDSAPGQLTVRYIDNSGNEYISYKNIDIGNAVGLQAFLFDVNDMTPVSNTSYCQPSGQHSQIHISNVALAQINNPSGLDGYGDYTNLTAQLSKSQNYTLNVSENTPWNYYWRAWIDYNQNGTFESSELVLSKNNQAANTVSQTFTVPANASTGITRMRIYLKYYGDSAPTPCENIGLGEVEDYTINISNSNKIANEIIPNVRNYPNPFSDYTTIEYTLNDNSPVTIFVSDLNGRQVAVLIDDEQQETGTHTTTFNGSNYPAGMYYYTIQAGNLVATRKMTLFK